MNFWKAGSFYPPSTCQVCHTEPRWEVNKTTEKCEDWWNELETTIQMCRGKTSMASGWVFFFIFVLLSILCFDIYDYRHVFMFSPFCFARLCFTLVF